MFVVTKDHLYIKKLLKYGAVMTSKLTEALTFEEDEADELCLMYNAMKEEVNV